MSFQAYLDSIQKKTGMSVADFEAAAKKKGLLRVDVRAAEAIAWLKKDYGLGHGHAMALYGVLWRRFEPKRTAVEKVDRHFSGGRARWKTWYDTVLGAVRKFGPDVGVKPTDTYVSLLRSGKKFAIVQVTSGEASIGIKLKREKPTSRFEPAGRWNTMVTHRVRFAAPKAPDAALMSWLKKAYESA